MAVTTRKKAAPAAATKKAAAAPKKLAAKRTATKAQAEPQSAEEESESEEEGQDSEEEGDSEDEEGEEEESEDEAMDATDESSDEETFKIHTPKASTQTKVAPAALPTVAYEDDSEEDDSDAAPEAESLSNAKAKVLSAQDKEQSFLSKVQAEQKAKRVERETKLKAQKELSKKKTSVKAQEPKKNKDGEESKTTKSGLPTMLPMDILESVVQMDAQGSSSTQGSLKANDKKRKHMRPEDFALMELEAELKAETQKRKKAEKIQRNVGPVTVKVLERLHLAKGHAIPETIVDFRKQHFYGAKVQRKDAVLNLSQRNNSAASKFNRRK
ncbi:hypothetical protein BC939DRAFT_459720 [Gamsiella multidivaricata]|uniref:uncharacterized protein n=1 Tax=Gamsiella multidivaricata TaxID=101098 RepID=UPI0022207AFD|nr:uncharacterized protein BC939DRAFT_459720 [Gamsiella multidivaricata]KAG0370672.1 hypothetical protein BGZ54_004988 [Gamsiella multidivaricata]KAI7819603.1 hypothetical protein BC939DRAFT_459720 [Gamsiella multidivaricata]